MVDIPIVNGDIFESGAEFILHQVNCQGRMGSGVAKQVRERYPKVFQRYKDFINTYRKHGLTPLGEVQYCTNGEKSKDGVTSQVIVNMFAQNNYGYDGQLYTDYNALQECLTKVNNTCADLGGNIDVAIPYLMACHRGGGDWSIVSKMIHDTLKDCDVTFYRYTAG